MNKISKKDCNWLPLCKEQGNKNRTSSNSIRTQKETNVIIAAMASIAARAGYNMISLF